MKMLLLILLAVRVLPAQSGQPTCATVSPAAAKLEFDAASVKPAGPFDPATAFAHGPVGILTGGPGTNEPGRITSARVALESLIMAAFGLEQDQVKGPGWTEDTLGNGFAISATLPAASTKEEYCGMLRNLLTSRFHVAFHVEKQSRPGYELTVLPGGPKFKPYDPDAPAPEAAPILPPSQPRGIASSLTSSGTKITFRNDMAAFTSSLGHLINRSNGANDGGVPLPRVVDKTGLTGVYNFHLEFAGVPANLTAPRDPNAPASGPADAGPTIFDAVRQQLGLNLTKVKDVPVDVLIIDRADQTPTGN